VITVITVLFWGVVFRCCSCLEEEKLTRNMYVTGPCAKLGFRVMLGFRVTSVLVNITLFLQKENKDILFLY
jgi:hypothetical protein